MKPTEAQILAAAAAIARSCGMRHGMPPIENVLDLLSAELREAVRDDAEAALTAAEEVRIKEKSNEKNNEIAAAEEAA